MSVGTVYINCLSFSELLIVALIVVDSQKLLMGNIVWGKKIKLKIQRKKS